MNNVNAPIQFHVDRAVSVDSIRVAPAERATSDRR